MTRPLLTTAWRVISLAVIAGGLIITTAGGCSKPRRYSRDHEPLLGDHQEVAEMKQERRPTSRTLSTLADILATQGKDRQCEFVLQRCMEEYPQFMPAYNHLAELLMRQGRVPEALAVLSNALRIQPMDPVLLNNLGMCLMVRKQYDQALERFTEAAGLRPENHRYRANMAAALGLLGRYEESLSLLRQVLREPLAEHNAQVLRQAAQRIPPSSSPLPD